MDAGDGWEHRRTAVVDLIRGSGASIVGVQEARPQQLAFLVEALSPDYTCTGDGRDADRSGEACPLFVHARDFEVMRSETLWISPTPGVPGSKHDGALCARFVTCTVLRQPQLGGGTL